MAITASQVKELRGATGAGMMDAKKALVESGGDFDAAVDWLRTKGLAKAAKKSGRVAAEGLVALATGAGVAVAVEINSETDFVAKNADFQEMVKSIAAKALETDGVESLAAAEIDGKRVSDMIISKISTIGENMALRRMAKLRGDKIVTYVHNAAAEGMGKIGVLVAMTGDNEAFGRQVAMHVAAASPAALKEDELEPTVIEKEKKVQMDIARESGKPKEVVERMVGGRMKKWLAEVTLLNQGFVLDPDKTVAEAARDVGVEITGFVRLEVGEGIDKAEEDFAAEVAKAMEG